MKDETFPPNAFPPNAFSILISLEERCMDAKNYIKQEFSDGDKQRLERIRKLWSMGFPDDISWNIPYEGRHMYKPGSIDAEANRIFKEVTGKDLDGHEVDLFEDLPLCKDRIFEMVKISGILLKCDFSSEDGNVFKPYLIPTSEEFNFAAHDLAKKFINSKQGWKVIDDHYEHSDSDGGCVYDDCEMGVFMKAVDDAFLRAVNNYLSDT